MDVLDKLIDDTIEREKLKELITYLKNKLSLKNYTMLIYQITDVRNTYRIMTTTWDSDERNDLYLKKLKALARNFIKLWFDVWLISMSFWFSKLLKFLPILTDLKKYAPGIGKFINFDFSVIMSSEKDENGNYSREFVIANAMLPEELLIPAIITHLKLNSSMNTDSFRAAIIKADLIGRDEVWLNGKDNGCVFNYTPEQLDNMKTILVREWGLYQGDAQDLIDAWFIWYVDAWFFWVTDPREEHDQRMRRNAEKFKGL